MNITLSEVGRLWQVLIDGERMAGAIGFILGIVALMCSITVTFLMETEDDSDPTRVIFVILSFLLLCVTCLFLHLYLCPEYWVLKDILAR